MSHPLRQPWAITEEGLQLVLSIWSRADLFPEVLAKARADFGDRPMGQKPTMAISGSVATIPIRGPLFARAGMFSDISGAASYASIGADLEQALADQQVRSIVLSIDSPGGEVTGVQALADQIRTAARAKPVVAHVDGYGASAAYWLASAASRIVAAPTAMLGSIGVRTALIDDAEKAKASGERRIEIISSQSPGKRSTPVDDALLARIQARVDDLAQVFVDAVALHRGVDVAHVLERFGAGDVMIASRALSAKMIDRVGTLGMSVLDAHAMAGTTAKMTAGRAPAARSKRMTHKELAAALAERAAQDETLAPMAQAAVKLSQEHEQALLDRAKAQDRADAVAYEDAIRAGHAERKITGPAHEARVRSSYPSLADLQRYLSAAEPAPVLNPEKPAAQAQAPLSEADRAYIKVMRQRGMAIDENEYARRKAEVGR